jgi:hypothetical protein
MIWAAHRYQFFLNEFFMVESDPQSFGKLKSILTSLRRSIFDEDGDWWQKYLVVAHLWALSEKRKNQSLQVYTVMYA